MAGVEMVGAPMHVPREAARAGLPRQSATLWRLKREQQWWQVRAWDCICRDGTGVTNGMDRKEMRKLLVQEQARPCPLIIRSNACHQAHEEVARDAGPFMYQPYPLFSIPLSPTLYSMGTEDSRGRI